MYAWNGGGDPICLYFVVHVLPHMGVLGSDFVSLAMYVI